MFFYFSFIFWLLAYSTHQAVQPLGSTAIYHGLYDIKADKTLIDDHSPWHTYIY